MEPRFQLFSSFAETWLVIACLSVIFLVGRYLKRWKDMGYVAGYRPIFAPLSLPGILLPTCWYNYGQTWSFDLRKTSYFNKEHDLISIIPILVGPPMLYIGSTDVAQQLIGRESLLFSKDPDFNQVFTKWGSNVISSHGQAWKRQRRVVAPAFNQKMLSGVVAETEKLYGAIEAGEGWVGKTVATMSNISQRTLHLAFVVMCRCGFDIPMKWAPEGETDGFDVHSTFEWLLSVNIMELAIPQWCYILPIPFLKKLRRAKTSLLDYLNTSINTRINAISSDPQYLDSKSDVFTRLVASSVGLDKYAVDRQEIIGNLFVLMFAGHETTGYVIAETLAHLALHQEEQDKAYEEVRAVLRERSPTYEDVQKMTHLFACFLESARIYPPGSSILRIVPEDMVVRVERPAPAEILVKKGTKINIDMISIHHNPHTFPDPSSFKPSRWYGVPDTQATMFGYGPRACFGRKFSQMEGITFLALLLRDWHVDIVLKDGETRAEWEERVMHKVALLGLTFGIEQDIPIRLTRRQR